MFTNEETRKDTQLSRIDPVLKTMFRILLYTIAVFLFTYSLPYALEHGDIAAFKEDGFIEWVQVLILLGAIFMFFLTGALNKAVRIVFAVLFCFTVFALIRELDALLDSLVPFVGWKFGYLSLAFMAFLLFRHWRDFLNQLRILLSSRAGVILWAGFIVAVPIGQLIGDSQFLESLMGDDYSRDYKRVIEEILELIGYLLVIISSIESYVELIQERSFSSLAFWMARMPSALEQPEHLNISKEH